MPERVPEPVPLLKPTPLGGVPPVWVTVGVGEPVALTGKLLLVPTVKVVLLLLVNAGGAPMSMVTLTVALSTVAVPLPSPAVFPAV